ncbi:MAG: metallophosphoesterase [Planctomycetota bacterium]
MRVFSISDLHLSFAKPKPMDIFGEAWKDHPARLERAWRERVGGDDVVLLAGDLSWALRLEDALPDLAYLHTLPGRKVLIKGNHDYWWTSEAKVRAVLPPSISILSGHAMHLGDSCGVAGTRLWLHPQAEGATEADAKIYRRELGRLARALQDLDRLRVDDRVALVHYPPTSPEEVSDAERLLVEHGVRTAIYGHLHGTADQEAGVKGAVRGITYMLTSADFLDFTPALVRDGRC